MTGEVDPWPRICAEMWADKLHKSVQLWPAEKTITHVCEDDKPQPIATPNEQRVLDLLEAGAMSVGALAETLCIRVDNVSVLLNRMQRRGFVTHEGRTWLAKPSA
ncbi:MAG: hypothetical protein V9G29_00680 [Burkholderiaceae bacterium]